MKDEDVTDDQVGTVPPRERGSSVLLQLTWALDVAVSAIAIEENCAS